MVINDADVIPELHQACAHGVGILLPAINALVSLLFSTRSKKPMSTKPFLLTYVSLPFDVCQEKRLSGHGP